MAERGVQVATWAAVIGIAAVGGVLVWDAVGRPGWPLGGGDAREAAHAPRAEAHALEPDPIDAARLARDADAAAGHAAPRAGEADPEAETEDDAHDALARAAGAPSAIPEPGDDYRIEEIEDLDAAHAEIRSELARILLSDADPIFRVAAAQKIAESDSDDARATLIQALRDPDPAVLVQVLEGLEDIHDQSAVRYIEPLLRHPDPDVAEAAHLAIELLE